MNKRYFPNLNDKASQESSDKFDDKEVYAELKIPVRQLALLIAMHLPQQEKEQPAQVAQDEDLTPKECAEILRCSISTIYRRTHDLQLHYHRIGNAERGPIFIKRSDLEKLKVTKRLNGIKF